MNDFGGAPDGFHQLGKTPDPCGVKFAVLRAIIAWTSSGEPSQYDGMTGTSPSGKVYQIVEGRLGKPGQAANLTINSRTTPYIYSVIKFDSAGNATYTEHSMFPTFSVYVNGTLTKTFPQSRVSCFVGTPSQCFAGQDQTYQLTPSQIQ